MELNAQVDLNGDGGDGGVFGEPAAASTTAAAGDAPVGQARPRSVSGGRRPSLIKPGSQLNAIVNSLELTAGLDLNGDGTVGGEPPPLPSAATGTAEAAVAPAGSPPGRP
eukprot:1451427-Prymnesium_polylepis.1